MITWMQRHNRYLVWTIWIATIAFIGAGFVGWGSYRYGSKASAVGKVGAIEISRERLSFTYSNLYNQYKEALKGDFDEAKAKEMGLTQSAFRTLVAQAQLLNLARDYGIVVSDKELADYIASLGAFQENGVFNATIYKTYLKNRGLKSSTFEAILSDELTLKKLMQLIEHPATDFEVDAVASALRLQEKVAYRVLTPDPNSITVDDAAVRAEWNQTREQYMTPQSYALSVLWTDTQSIDVNASDVRAFFDKNSFNYIDKEGKIIPFEQAKADAEKDLKIKRGKKKALLDYIALKKGNKQPTETLTLPMNDPALPAELWAAVAQADTGTLLKPKPIGTRYATVRIDKIIAPHPMPYEQAKPRIVSALKARRAIEAVQQQAQTLLQTIDKAMLTTSDYFSLTQPPALFPLNRQESLQFVEKLFTSSGKKGIITLSSRIVVYKIVDQRIGSADANLTAQIRPETDRIKRQIFEKALFDKLNTRFPAEAYVKGL